MVTGISRRRRTGIRGKRIGSPRDGVTLPRDGASLQGHGCTQAELGSGHMG